jgi:hypothetical protein
MNEPTPATKSDSQRTRSVIETVEDDTAARIADWMDAKGTFALAEGGTFNFVREYTTRIRSGGWRQS